MNKQEAKEIIRKQLDVYRRMPYFELIKLIDADPIAYEIRGPSGVLYQIEIEAFWDDKPNGNIRVVGSIDDGGLRAFVPLSDDFIKNSKDEFIRGANQA
jgi:hypothetical protein